eukprot:g5455.t1
MGHGTSSFQTEDTDFLSLIAGSVALPPSDSRWVKGFEHMAKRRPLPLEPYSPTFIQSVLGGLCEELCKNNCDTRNFQAFLEHTIARLRILSFPAATKEEEPTASDVVCAANSLFVARLMISHFVKKCSRRDLLSHFSTSTSLRDEVEEEIEVENRIGESGKTIIASESTLAVTSRVATLPPAEGEVTQVVRNSRGEIVGVVTEGVLEGREEIQTEAVENKEEEETLKQASRKVRDIFCDNLAFEFLEVLIKICTQQKLPHDSMNDPDDANMYVLRIEVMNLLLVFLSSRLYTDLDDKENSKIPGFTELLLRPNSCEKPGGGRWAHALFPALLSQVINPLRTPSEVIRSVERHLSVYQQNIEESKEKEIESETKTTEKEKVTLAESPKGISKLIRTTSDTMMSALAFPAHLYRMIFPPAGAPQSPLAQRALLLLMALVHSPACKDAGNPYKVAICNLADEDNKTFEGASSLSASSSIEKRLSPKNESQKSLFSENGEKTNFGSDPSAIGGANRPWFVQLHVSYHRLYDAASSVLHCSEGVLFLYSLLQWNSSFREYVLARGDPEVLIYPLLKALHKADEVYNEDPSHVYVLVIIMLIFSQDASFNKHVHLRVRLAEVPWFESYVLQNITLGSLMFLILLRVLQTNMSKMQDAHVHTYCTAALANVSHHCEGLHQHPSQRLVGLIRVLVRKYVYVTNLIKTQENSANGVGGVERGEKGGRSIPELLQVQETCGVLLRMMLEICSAMLNRRMLRSNVALVYALLHEKRIAQDFEKPNEFSALFAPIKDMIDFVTAQLKIRLSATRKNERNVEIGIVENEVEKPREWTMESVTTELKEIVQVWKGPTLPGGPAPKDATFQYEETGDPVAFFLPYVWKAVMRQVHDVNWEEV